MRASGVLLSVLCAFTAGGIAGFSLAHRATSQDLARLQQDYNRGLIRERELRAQLEESLAARAALTQETQQLQENLSERLRRLEEATAKLTSPEKSENQP
jgi:uncharacterized membrane protein